MVTVRGAFTGAVRDEPGHFRLAEGGTLFLDEIAELSFDLQAKLLRVLQERVVVPVGGRAPIPVNVRVVSATHRSLRQAVAEGEFRADLMYRVRVVPLYLPRLAERGRDVLHIARRFIDEQNAQGERQIREISPEAQRALLEYDFPGNVRELHNVIEYAFAMGEGPLLLPTDLPPEIRTDDLGEAEPAPTKRAVNVPRGGGADDERSRILYALERSGGHRGRAAASLGISRATLWRRMRSLSIEDG